MSRFVLTAQLQLQAPSNTRQVVQQIQRQLQGGVNLNVQLQNAPATQKQLTQINKQVSNLNTQGKSLSKNFGISIRRFASFTIASRAVSLFTNKLAGAVDEAIKFEREIVKIAQVTGKSVQSLDGLTKTISSLSTNLGVASQELVSTTRILAQAGIKANDLEVALAALAKTTLAPTFEDINKTAEGAVAILAQFKQGVGALEGQLGSINKVAGQFAVESGDLISAVRRFGGVFKSAGGELDELLGLFTSVRATTRESAESIATGLRTIFTRIQRPKTIEFLKQFGVQLTDLEGKFVGPFEAVRQLSQAFAGLEEGDITFVKVAEELGGFRQIGKVIPLIQQFTVAEKARQAALEGRGSLDADAAKAQQSLAVQISKVREEFFALIRGISETGTFQILVKSTLALTSQLIKLADAFKPLLPILASFAAIKIGASIGNIARGVGAGVLGRNQGGPIGFASGGVVPGTGNRDTVPAMLTPGEFVIKKSSVKSLGAGTLAAMNNNRFQAGGKQGFPTGSASSALRIKTNQPLKPSRSSTFGQDPIQFGVRKNRIGGFILNPSDRADSTYVPQGPSKFIFKNQKTITSLAKRAGKSNKEAATLAQRGVPAVLDTSQGFPEFYPAKGDIKKNPKINEAADRGAKKGLKEAITRTVKLIDRAKLLDISPQFKSDPEILTKVQSSLVGDKSVVSTVAGYLFEGMIGAFTGAVAAGGQTNFDFPASSLRGNIDKLSSFFGDSRIKSIKKAEGKRSQSEFTKGVVKKTQNDLNDFGYTPGSGVRIIKGFSDPKTATEVNKQGRPTAAAKEAMKNVNLRSGLKRNSGGGVPASSDTVPALLTPGEFVFNKGAAQSIGYGNLNTMNKQGVVGFAKGGAVGGIQKFQAGGQARGGAAGIAGILALQSLPVVIDTLSGSSDNATKSLADLEQSGFNTQAAFSKLVTAVTTTGIALAAFGVQLNKASLKKGLQLFGTGKGSLGEKIRGRTRGGAANLNNSFGSQFRIGSGSSKLGRSNIAGRPTGLIGRAGRGLGNLSSRGGLLGRGAGLLGRAGAAAGAGSLGGAAASVAAFAGPLAAAGLAVKGLSAALNAGFDAQGKYNRAVKEGNVEKAKEFAVQKEVSGISQALGSGFVDAELAVRSFFGGPSKESIEALAGAAAGAAKSIKDIERNNKELDKTLRSLKDGAISLDEAFATGQITSNIKTLQAQLNTTRAAQATNVRTNRAGVGREIFGTLPGVESAGAKNARLTEQQQKANKEALAQLNKEIEKQIPLFRDLARQTIIGGGSLEDFIKAAGLEGIDRNSEAVKRVTEEYFNQIPALKRAAEAAEAINLGLGTTNRVTTGLNATLSAINNPASKLEQSLSTLEAVSKGGVVGSARLTESLESVTGTLESFGASEQQLDKINKTFTALSVATNGAEVALAKIRDNFAGGGAFDAAKFSDQFAAAVSGGDAGTEEILSSLFADFKPSQGAIDNFIGGNFGKILEELQAQGKGAFDELLPSVQAVIQAQSQLATASQNLVKAKIEEAAATKRSIDLQKEAAAIIEEFGGKALSASDKVGFLEQKVAADFGAGATLDAGSLRGRANASLAGFGFDQGDDPRAQQANAEARDKAKRTQENTLKIAQERIKLYREEIAVAKQKLKLEQDAAQALLANDVAKFAENINASIAASAFRTGDTQSLQALGGEAVAAGFASLTDTEKKASKGQLEALGLSSGLADSAAGTSPEIQALEAEARQFAQVIADVATNLKKISQLEREEFERRKAQADEEYNLAQQDANNKASELKDNTNIQTQNNQIANAEAKTATEEQKRKSKEDKAAEDAAIKAEEQANKRALATAPRSQLQYFGEEGQEELERRDRQRQRTNQQFANRTALYSTGGTVYASRGMFIPKGTDTVPAMLTPGEFVVNRSAVQRGNNLQILRSMNGGDTAPNGAPAAMSKGGSVGYYNEGGEVAGGMGDFISGMSQAISQLGGAFGTFSQSVQQLANMKLSVNLSPTRVDVNVIGPMLSELTEATKEVVLNAVVSEIQLNQLGQLERTV